MDQQKKYFTLAQIAKLTQTQLVGSPDKVILGVAGLDSATPNDISFLGNPRYEKSMQKSAAGAIFIAKAPPKTSQKENFLIAKDPSRAFQIMLENFSQTDIRPSYFEEIHPSAIIHDTAKIKPNVRIAPGCVVDAYVVIEDHTSIEANCYIGPHSQIGKECHIHSNVTIREHSILKDRVILQPGVVIGSCGFGYTTDSHGKHTKLTQTGNVILEEDVEVGANTTIDRARFGSTKIGKGTKIDNLAQIAHGVQIGEGNILVAQTGIAGSAQTGNHVVLAARSGLVGHVRAGHGVQLAACSVVCNDLPDGQKKYGGFPAVSLDKYNRQKVHLKNIQKHVNRIKALEKRLRELENQV